MKKGILKLFTVFSVIVLAISSVCINVFAAGSSSISFSKSTVSVGETFTVTAKFSVTDKMEGVEGCLTYDSSLVEFVPVANDQTCSDKGGQVFFVHLCVEGYKTTSKTFTFKSKKVGQSNFSVEDLVYVSGSTESSMSSTKKTLTVVNPAAKSSNANLSSLTVSSGTLTPKFSSDVTSYNVTIPYEETELLVSAKKADSDASYVVNGSKDMKVGYNKRSIVVTAPNGTKKTYTINITRLDKEGKVPSDITDTPINDKIEVVIDGNIMYLDEDFTTYEIPDGFSIIEDYVYDGRAVPALSDGKSILLHFSMPDGSFSDFYEIGADDSFTRLKYIKVGEATYYLLTCESVPDGYVQVSEQINGINVDGYKSTDTALADFVLIYAKGPNGYTGFYRYDTLEKTMQRAVEITLVPASNTTTDTAKSDDNIIARFNGLSANNKIIVVTALAVMLLLVVAIILLIIKLAIGHRERKSALKDHNLDNTNDGENLDFAEFEYVTLTEGTKNTLESETVTTDEEELSSETESDLPNVSEAATANDEVNEEPDDNNSDEEEKNDK